MPVLPLVGSRIVQPDDSSPSSSARAIMPSAARSLSEPVGLWSSSFAHSRTSGDGDNVGRPTIGVWPTESTRESKRTLLVPAASHCGKYHDGVAVGDRGLEPAGEADVLVVDVDVDEATHTAILDEPLLDAGVIRLQILDELGHGAALAVDGALAVGERAQDRGDSDLDGHQSAAFCVCVLGVWESSSS